MNVLLRAIITGFGYKIGTELGRFVAEQTGLSEPAKKKKEPDVPPGGLPRDEPPDEEEAAGDALEARSGHRELA